MRWLSRSLLPTLLFCLIMSCGASGAAAETPLRVNTFPSPQNLPLYVAQSKGLFAKRGLVVQIQVTRTSKGQRDGLISGKFEIAQSGVDNALALVEGAKKDVIIVSGGSSGLNELIVRPEIKTYGDIRGKTVVVDASNTAFALILYKMLALNGLKKGDYSVDPIGACSFRRKAMQEDPTRVAAMMNPPCSYFARRDGFRSFGLGTDVIGPYLADGHWVLRSWAKSHADTLVKYLQAIIEGYRWGADPAHRGEVVAIMAKFLKVDPDIAAQAVEAELGTKGGLAKDAAFDMVGFRNTLKLRAELEGGDSNANPEKYIDLSYYQRALSSL